MLEYFKSNAKCIGGKSDCLMRKSNYKIVESIAPDVIKDKNVLLVDDCAGTGTTLYRGKEHMYDNGASNVKSLVISTVNPSLSDFYLFRIIL